jgi:putative acetyltransferase
VDETRWRQKLADSIGTVAVVNSQPVGFITAVDAYRFTVRLAGS